MTPLQEASASGLIVLESYGGSRPRAAPALLIPIYEELVRSAGATHVEDLKLRVESKLSRPGESLSPQALRKTTQWVETGFENYQRGRFASAQKMLGNAIRTYRRYPATLARNREARLLYRRALIYLAATQQKSGQRRLARETMTSYVRYFPDQNLSRSEHGEQPYNLYLSTKTALDLRPRSQLHLTVDEPDTIIFIDGRFEGPGSRTIRGLYPGLHSVYVQKGATSGRVHDIELEPGKSQAVSIQWSLDHALYTKKDGFGLRFPNEAIRARLEPKLAVAIAQATQHTAVIVLGVRPLGGQLSIVGIRISLDSDPSYLKVTLPVDSVHEAPELLETFAQRLNPAPQPTKRAPNHQRTEQITHIELPTAKTSAQTQKRSPSLTQVPLPIKRDKRGDSKVVPWTLVGAGLAVGAAGAALLILHNPGEPCEIFSSDDALIGQRCDRATQAPINNPLDVATPGALLAGTGAVMTIVGSVMLLPIWKTKEHNSKPQTVGWRPLSQGGLVTLSGHF